MARNIVFVAAEIKQTKQYLCHQYTLKERALQSHVKLKIDFLSKKHKNKYKLTMILFIQYYGKKTTHGEIKISKKHIAWE